MSFSELNESTLQANARFHKGPTIRKVMGGGGWGKNQKKIHARENAKKKNSRKEEGAEKKFMQKEGPIVTFIYSAFHKTFDRRYAKFVVNLITWEFQYVTVNQRANFESVKKG